MYPKYIYNHYLVLLAKLIIKFLAAQGVLGKAELQHQDAVASLCIAWRNKGCADTPGCVWFSFAFDVDILLSPSSWVPFDTSRVLLGARTQQMAVGMEQLLATCPASTHQQKD